MQMTANCFENTVRTNYDKSINLESTMVATCAPTLAGVKPANLVSFRTVDKAALYELVLRWQEILAPHRISVRILKECSLTPAFLVYVYRQNWLADILSQSDVQLFLSSEGYRIYHQDKNQGGPVDTDKMLGQLSNRLCQQKTFPHDVGIFLGYPLEDVVGFIEHKGQNYTYCGLWKSYGDPVKAEAHAQVVLKCISMYRKLFESGTSIGQLVVAV